MLIPLSTVNSVDQIFAFAIDFKKTVANYLLILQEITISVQRLPIRSNLEFIF